MTDVTTTGPYVYQPYGMQDGEHWEAGRIYGVAGIDPLATVRGLTKAEARAFVAASTLLDALEIILPMAKGYAAAHRVGSNAEYIRVAEAAVRKAKGD